MEAAGWRSLLAAAGAAIDPMSTRPIAAGRPIAVGRVLLLTRTPSPPTPQFDPKGTL